MAVPRPSPLDAEVPVELDRGQRHFVRCRVHLLAADGTQIFGTFDETGTEFINQITNKMQCLHGSVDGNLNGHSIKYTVTWSDGSGTSSWYGQIGQTSFSVGGAPGAVATDTFVPGNFSEYEQYLSQHNYPNCT